MRGIPGTQKREMEKMYCALADFAEIQNRERVATHLNLVCACVVCGLRVQVPVWLEPPFRQLSIPSFFPHPFWPLSAARTDVIYYNKAIAF